MKIKKRYDDSQKITYSSDKKSRVRQSEKDNVDINKIMERFNRSGKIPAMQRIQPFYGDAIALPYDQALKVIKAANDSFNMLSAKARAYFQHNPQNLLTAIQNPDPANQKKLLELGITAQAQPTTEALLTELVKETKKAKIPVEKNGGNSDST